MINTGIPLVDNAVNYDQAPDVPLYWNDQNRQQSLMEIFILVVALLLVAHVLFMGGKK